MQIRLRLPKWTRARRDGTPQFADAKDARRQAARLVDEGQLVDALDQLADAQRDLDDPELAAELVDVRLAAAKSYEPGPGRMPWPPTYADPFPGVTGRIPEIDASELTADVLGGAVAHHGAVIARGVFDAAQVKRCVEA